MSSGAQSMLGPIPKAQRDMIRIKAGSEYNEDAMIQKRT
jgi:hypothetical protein